MKNKMKGFDRTRERASDEYPGKKDLGLDFSDTQIAFQGLTDQELYQSWLIFSAFRYRLLVTQGPKLAQMLMKVPLLGSVLISPLIEKTVFAQFCGGPSLEGSLPRVGRLATRRVGAILDYSVEGLGIEKDFDDACQAISQSIRYARDHQTELPLAVFKASAMMRSALLEKKSKNQAFNLEESKQWDAGVARIDRLFKEAFDLQVRLMVDAEETWLQPAIDQIVYEGMKKYNLKQAVIYNTLQMYRTDRLQHFESMLKMAGENSYYLGMKIVRGAYMEKERLWAKSQGHLSPICETKDQVDQFYDQAVKLGLENTKFCALVIGTHNELSTYRAIEVMKTLGIERHNPHVVFSQLLGMSDHISFNLSHHGYRVAKYVPYGPLEAVMPYLGRRAEENSSIQGQIGRELGLIQKEMSRRREVRKI